MIRLMLLAVLFSTSVLAQLPLYQSPKAHVLDEDSTLLLNAFAGGILAPIPHGFYLNDDELEDIILWDVHGRRFTTYLATGESTQYKYAPYYEQFLPQITNTRNVWVRFADYNNDGLQDLFTLSDLRGNNAQVYKNIGRKGKPQFEQIVDEIMVERKNGSTELLVGTNEIPYIDDFDGDGDVDIITFAAASICGAGPFYYKNMSMELYGHSDSLIYYQWSNCWGYFREGAEDETVILHQPCCTTNIKRKAQHSSSTLLFLDTDADGDKDLLLGDLEYNSIQHLTNGKAQFPTDEDTVTTLDKTYPPSIPVQITTMPLPSLIDIDNDGRKDLLFTPMEPRSGSALMGYGHTDNFWYYRDSNFNQAPVYVLKSKNFLVNTMLDVGYRALPVALDVDKDGKQDILLLTSGLDLPAGSDELVILTRASQLEADTQLFAMDKQRISIDLKGGVPAVATVDDKGPTLFLAAESGLFYYPSKAGVTESVEFNTATALPLLNSDGQHINYNTSGMCFYDLDNDGDRDLFYVVNIFGLYSLAYAENIGDTNQYSFKLRTLNFGRLATYTAMYPAITDWDADGAPELLMGTANRGLFYYDNLSSDSADTLTGVPYYVNDPLTEQPIPSNFGVAYPVAITLDDDSIPDLAIGTLSGGMVLFSSQNRGVDTLGIGMDATSKQGVKQQLNIYPNPASSSITVRLEGGTLRSLSLYSVTGVLIQHFNTIGEEQLEVALPQELSPALYLIKCETREGITLWGKVVKL